MAIGRLPPIRGLHPKVALTLRLFELRIGSEEAKPGAPVLAGLAAPRCVVAPQLGALDSQIELSCPMGSTYMLAENCYTVFSHDRVAVDLPVTCLELHEP